MTKAVGGIVSFEGPFASKRRARDGYESLLQHKSPPFGDDSGFIIGAKLDGRTFAGLDCFNAN